MNDEECYRILNTERNTIVLIMRRLLDGNCFRSNPEKLADYVINPRDDDRLVELINGAAKYLCGEYNEIENERA